MSTLKSFAHRSTRGRMFRAVAALALVLGMSGCTTPLGRSPMASIFSDSNDADVAKAAARDSFPTAAQAGIVSQEQAQ